MSPSPEPRLVYLPVTIETIPIEDVGKPRQGDANLGRMVAMVGAVMIGDHEVSIADYLALEAVEPDLISPLGYVNYGMSAVVGLHVQTGVLVKCFMDHGEDLPQVFLADSIPEEEEWA